MRDRLKRTLNGRPWIQVWLPGPAQLDRLALPHPDDRAHALSHHQRADDAEQEHIGDANGDVELAERAQGREQPNPERGADEAAGKQHEGEREIDASGGASS